MKKRLLHNVNIVTMNDKNEIILNGYVVIDEERICEVGTNRKFIDEEKRYDKINMKGKWLLPGLINTHTHTPMTLFRGIGDDLPLKRWLEEKMWPLEAKLTRDDVIAATHLAMLEMVKSGTTTFLDMYHLFLDEIGQLIENSGMRAVLTRGMIGHCSENEQRAKLNESIRVVTAWNGAADGRITTMLSPHSFYTCPPDFIEAVVALARQNDVALHIHLAETKAEVEEHVSQHGKSPIEHLAELHFFEGHSLVAHAVWLTAEEMDLFAEKHVSVSHNPLSNLKLASGIAPVAQLLERGVNVSLGTDSVASNNSFDLFEEMRMSALLQKGTTNDPQSVTSDMALQLATRNGAKALQLSDVGSIEVGKFADFITIDPTKPHLQPSYHFPSHLVYAARGSDVVDVFVQGKQLMKDRECLTLDEEQIIAEANERFFDIIKK